ncbi:MAG TPA: hypothetical protein VEW74_03480 [Candidatus Nitrosotalea sp.]|nr:hypothetical protein [Candidatus Nitrosotalea sp.]
MDEYFIGAGALLTAGERASVVGATLHAQPDPGLARGVKAALVDFESTELAEISRLLIVAAGWSVPRFRDEVAQRLLDQGECLLADVIGTLAEAVVTKEVHIFAHWRPDAATVAALAERGIGLVVHPLEAIGPAALVSGQRLARWRRPGRAA